jgi:hypothetical protein
MIGAFMRTFAPGQAILMFKTSKSAPKGLAPYPDSPGASITQWLKDDRARANGWTADNVDIGVKVMREAFTTAQMMQLHKVGDVYVTLSRGEGWDMPAFDAKLAGNRMVFTRSGGPQEFATNGDHEVAARDKVLPCHPFYGWKESTYLDFSIEVAGEAMLSAARAIHEGTSAEHLDIERFTMIHVGKRMRGHVDDLAQA